jgi:hypothetical protein
MDIEGRLKELFGADKTISDVPAGSRLQAGCRGAWGVCGGRHVPG